MVSERDLAMVVKQPILIGGLGLSVALGLLQVTHVNIIDSSTLLSVLALGTGVWWWRRRDRPPSSPAPLPPRGRPAAGRIRNLPPPTADPNP
jgi:hypothetical protein